MYKEIIICLLIYYIVRLNHPSLPPWGYMHNDHLDVLDDLDNKQKRIIDVSRNDIMKIYNRSNTMNEIVTINKYAHHLKHDLSPDIARIFNMKTHAELYTLEDTNLGKAYRTYIEHFTKTSGVRISTIKILQTIEYYGSVILHLKNSINRCRPYQAAKIYNIPFAYQKNESASTPSFPSGHAAQGILFAMLMYNEAKDYYDTHPDAFNTLVSYGSDTGLRRIYAGLHYPSDNEASAKINTIIADEMGISNNICTLIAHRIMKLNKHHDRMCLSKP